ncbi:unnamed protein product [Cunninghamella blakesleeana]
MHNCFRETRLLRKQLEDQNTSLPPLSTYKVHVCSENNFPTAAGLASSASGLAALVYTLAKLYELPMDMSELSKIARQGSGSACRSLFGGFVAWEKGEKEDGSDSKAVQIADEQHWPELQALICVVSDAKKGTSSTAGMQQTIQSSTLMNERINQVVPQRMKEMIQAIQNKDFNQFAELTMRDSNQFHSVCLDTFPPIFYLNDTSRGIIQLIHEYNKSKGDGYRAAYTYDAGPNAVIYALEKDMKEIIQLVNHYFPEAEFTDPYALFNDNQGQITSSSLTSNDTFNEKVIPVYPKGSVSRLLHTKVHDGPRVLSQDESLLNDQGLPKRLA